ncbi:MAG TPA: S9 family peptidase [Thermoanaerobaculia bacterium]|nr:S9 family peptidase [Thermoanaerobaculia bacterium]
MIAMIPLVLGAAERHPFSVEDLMRMERISDPQVSPDGKSVAFVVRTTDLAANRGRTDLWLMRTDGSELLRLTSDPAGDSSPRWASDGGSIFFLSSRTGSSQVWTISPRGGEATQVTNLPLDAANLVVSPTGEHLAISLEVDPGMTIQETADRLEAIEKSPESGQIYDQLIVRHWDTWKDGRRSHVFVIPAAGGDPVDVMKTMDADAPSKPFGGPEELTFTPDGRSIVFTARDVGREEAWSTNFDLFIAPIDGSSEPVNLTDANDAWDTQPVFSPDGKTLAWLAMERPGYESDRFRIRTMAWPVSAVASQRTLTAQWDRSPGDLAWSADGKTLYASAQNLGNHSLFAIDARSGEVRTILKEGTVRSPQPFGSGRDERLLFGLDNLRSPVELHSIRADGSDLRKLTGFNDENVGAVMFGEPEQFTFAGWNGETVHAWVVKPAGFQAGKKYPIAFLIHGGPQGSFGNDFHYRWNPQVYAGAGYGAVMIDFHGSTGYGQAFTDSIRGDWGGKPLEDLQKGLAAALDRYPWLDGDRVAALGASYGGYMINWIAGLWPDRFDCLVNHDGVFDQRMMYYATEELWFPEWEHLGTPWASGEHFEKHNPVLHVDRWKTPMLVVHGALDFRVPLTQGLGAFTALQRRGIPSRLLYFPDENHWVLKPANGIQWHQTVLEWMARWTK